MVCLCACAVQQAPTLMTMNACASDDVCLFVCVCARARFVCLEAGNELVHEGRRHNPVRQPRAVVARLHLRDLPLKKDRARGPGLSLTGSGGGGERSGGGERKGGGERRGGKTWGRKGDGGRRVRGREDMREEARGSAKGRREEARGSAKDGGNKGRGNEGEVGGVRGKGMAEGLEGGSE